PLRSSQRDHAHPLVIAGGPCTLNPEPMHDFFDAFVIDEAEEAVQEITALYQKHRLAYKQGALSKEDLLIMLTQIEGIYVPSLYDVSYTDSGAVKSFVARRPGIPHSINKRIVADLDKAFYPTAWLVPYLQTVHDRVALEIMRGCPNRCRFCQARVQYFPFRQRKIETVLQLAQKAYEASGYEEISLLGLSVSDYPCVESLVEQMVRLFVKKGVSVSLPSIRPMVKVAQVSSILARIKKTGLTFAPEAATDELRRTLGKNFDNSHFFAMLPQLFDAGYQRIKLYFMIGLPQERLEDLDAMVDFAFKVSQMRKRPGRGPAEVAMSVNTLIPKPHTPFQWLGLDQISLLQQKQAYLRDKIKRSRCLTLSFHNLEMSIIEAVLSRGDRRLSAVIEQAFRSEARFDAWEDHFSFSTWQEAFHHCGISYNTYLDARQRDEILPWDFINMGVSRSNLASEAP
ncbi:MAG: TIGR03960 family B12-binding radical SAM protein, partial [Candidatus Omnitrophica bacterium]|nr:TIGR03960 family B12-binding radical SAM protein [Candidatus Omnitrophota bacterium]